MHYYIFEDQYALDFDPLTATRPAFELRCGAFTFLERIQRQVLKSKISLIVRKELTDTVQERYPRLEVNPKRVEKGIWLLGNVLWKASELDRLLNGSARHYCKESRTVGVKLGAQDGQAWIDRGGPVSTKLNCVLPVEMIASPLPCYLWDLIKLTETALEYDCQSFNLGNVTENRRNDIFLINTDQIHIANLDLLKPGVCIDASLGPVIIEQNVAVGAGASISGPVYIGHNCQVSVNANIRSGTVAGPVCNLGGEINRSIFQGYTNKSHHGFLGDAYLGEWVNLGAGTNNSNLKNNYQPVTVSVNGQKIDSQILHVGVFIGDHCKTAIGTNINTGSLLGPVCNIISPGILTNSLPAFTFFLEGNSLEYRFNKFIETAQTVMNRRNQQFSEAQITLFKFLHANRLIN